MTALLTETERFRSDIDLNRTEQKGLEFRKLMPKEPYSPPGIPPPEFSVLQLLEPLLMKGAVT